MTGLDAHLTQMINGLAANRPVLTALMLRIASFGVPLMVFASALGWWAQRDRLSHRRFLIKTGLTFLAGLAINQLIVFFVHRMRPYDAGVTHLLSAPSLDPSFPSDHATAAFAIAVSFLLHGDRRPGALFLVAAVLVAFSRVFIGIHYLGDVVGGLGTALIAAIVLRVAYPEGNRLEQRLVRIL